MKNHPQSSISPSGLTCIEICSGAGGQAIGLERAWFEVLAHVEFDRHACETLRLNRPAWNVVEGDVRDFSAKEFEGLDLLAGTVSSLSVGFFYLQTPPLTRQPKTVRLN
jgi:DNA (cytosine-5)-methyltransferase 1